MGADGLIERTGMVRAPLEEPEAIRAEKDRGHLAGSSP